MAAQEKVAEISDDSSEDELNENENNNNSSPELLLEKKGILSKWTNYIHGWQVNCFAQFRVYSCSFCAFKISKKADSCIEFKIRHFNLLR